MEVGRKCTSYSVPLHLFVIGPGVCISRRCRISVGKRLINQLHSVRI